jgi:hypothetical protein
MGKMGDHIRMDVKKEIEDLKKQCFEDNRARERERNNDRQEFKTFKTKQIAENRKKDSQVRLLQHRLDLKDAQIMELQAFCLKFGLSVVGVLEDMDLMKSMVGAVSLQSI